MMGDKSDWPQVSTGRTEGDWPECLHNSGVGSFCRLSRGHQGLHREYESAWGDELRVVEEYQLLRAKLKTAITAIANIGVNYVGPDGRAAAAGVRNEVLKILAKELTVDTPTPAPRGP